MSSIRVSSDSIVRNTNEDATASRLSTVEAGYLQDPYAKLFAGRQSTSAYKRNPVIHRGTFVRTTMLDKLLLSFLQCSSKKTATSDGHQRQVVSLGAGSDTRYLRFRESDDFQTTKYFEIDFPEVTTRKVRILSKSNLFTESRIGRGGCEFYTDQYCLLSGDLREFESTLVPQLIEHGFDKSLPTLFIAECVIVYMLPPDADAIIRWVGQTCDQVGFVIYDPCEPHDAFGQVMIQNLRHRQIELPGLAVYPSLASQQARFLDCHWNATHGITIAAAHDNYIAADELKR
ncbi:S-adenosyl-L-methionine-dependent methyltransferase [Syncephalis fuscata]|nr:S-adenosyl-L-methionine-dependent methyltransferase [Syncephalis fuscata]